MRASVNCLFINTIVLFTSGAAAQSHLPVKSLVRATYLQAPDTAANRFTNVLPPPGSVLYTSGGLTPLPKDYYSKNLGFFCTKEIQVEKAVKFPLRLRLGSVSYCDKLEGKTW